MVIVHHGAELRALCAEFGIKHRLTKSRMGFVSQDFDLPNGKGIGLLFESEDKAAELKAVLDLLIASGPETHRGQFRARRAEIST